MRTTGTSSAAARARKRARRREREDAAYLGWIRSLPCVVCGSFEVQPHHQPYKAIGGGGDWSDFRTVPLCLDHHQGPRGIHRLHKIRFREVYGIDLERVMDELNEEYRREHGQDD